MSSAEAAHARIGSAMCRVEVDETAVKCADRNPGLIDQATKTLEHALRREGMLD
jgi:hypothetical protein